MSDLTLLDCTLRDGGYYNAWDFSPEIVNSYLEAMSAAQIDIVELGQRFISTSGYKGPYAYTTDEFLRGLNVPSSLRVAVMVNGADLLAKPDLEQTLAQLFPESKGSSPVDVVRIACHVHEFEKALPASRWLKDAGFEVGYNLMQVADRSQEEIENLAVMASQWPVDVLYFADSMGSMTPDQTAEIVGWLRSAWNGPIGIHTHDNMGLALQNSMRAAAEGVSWLDSTVTGMGRGPGNARTEEVVVEADDIRHREPNLVPLLSLIRKHMQPMKEHYGWGTNTYYYLSGKYGIHPTYIQEMVGDVRYDEEDILAVIDYLRREGGKKYSASSLASARTFFKGEPKGSWTPSEMLEGREVLLIGSGPGVVRHREAIESYIKRKQTVVMALNTKSGIEQALIDVRVACHPVRLLADSEEHLRLPQPLVTPASMLPESLRAGLKGKELLDFGLSVRPDTFAFAEHYCIAPNSLVIGYALAIAASGHASRILMVGFDGFEAGDARNAEMEEMLELIQGMPNVPRLVSVTPTIYRSLAAESIYGL